MSSAKLVETTVVPLLNEETQGQQAPGMVFNGSKIKVVHYEGPFQVSLKEVEMPEIQHPDDAIIKVTTAAICGPGLRMYQGRTAAEKGLVFGHDNMGIVIETGPGVTLLKKGNRIILPFKVADGRYHNCEKGRTAFCTGVNQRFAGGAYGYVTMGPYQGGQAQYLRVPYADFNALKLPPGKEHESDSALLADIFSTGWHGLVLAGFKPGESVAVVGAGPVGLMAAYSAVIRGASKVYVVDKVPERLRTAEKIGCTPVNFMKSDPVERMIKLNGDMVDRAVDAVGYQAVDSSGSKEKPNIVLDQLIKVTRPTGGLSLRTRVRQMSRVRRVKLSYLLVNYSRRVVLLGPANATPRRYLGDLIIAGRAKPSFVVSHEININNKLGAYEKFDKRIDGYTKVLIHPNGPL